MEKELTKVSKYLCFILRHKPQEIGLELDANGWGSVESLIEKTTGYALTRDLLEVVVETNDKQRFALNEDGTKIRANQGHSIDIEMDLPPLEPPQVLLHGTAERFWSSIEIEGLKKGNRHHVHLTESSAVAKSVGGRYGKPVILEVNASGMFKHGYAFFRTANNVWLVEYVPPLYLKKL
jgi:putative RNA 2'-phosphotransferase